MISSRLAKNIPLKMSNEIDVFIGFSTKRLIQLPTHLQEMNCVRARVFKDQKCIN